MKPNHNISVLLCFWCFHKEILWLDLQWNHFYDLYIFIKVIIYNRVSYNHQLIGAIIEIGTSKYQPQNEQESPSSYKISETNLCGIVENPEEKNIIDCSGHLSNFIQITTNKKPLQLIEVEVYKGLGNIIILLIDIGSHC